MSCARDLPKQVLWCNYAPFSILIAKLFLFFCNTLMATVSKVWTARSSMVNWQLWKSMGISLSVEQTTTALKNPTHTTRRGCVWKMPRKGRIGLFDAAALWSRMPLKIDSVDGSFSPGWPNAASPSLIRKRLKEAVGVLTWGPNAPLFK